MATGKRTEPTIWPPPSLKPVWNQVSASMPGTVVGDHRVDLLDAVLRRPDAERVVQLRRRRRGAGDVGRLGRDDRGRRVHDHHEFLGFGGDVGGGQRIRRQREAGEDVGVVAHDELLRQALGDVGRDAAGVLADELDLLAGDGVAVLLHVELDAVVDLVAGVGELAGIFVDHPDLDRVLRVGRTGAEQRQRKPASPNKNFCIAPSPASIDA